MTELGDGLRVVSERLPGVRSVSFGVWIGVGARDEDADVSGVSHFIEHLLFRGSRRNTALEIAQRFDRFGAELNAATSREHTSVHARVVDAHLDEAVAIVGAMVGHPTWDDLEPEREVVLEEIAMYEDAPDDLVFDLIGEAVFPDQGLGRPVIGTSAVIERLDRDAIARHHAAWYTPRNVVLSAAGAVDHDRLVELAAGELRISERGPAPVRLPMVEHPPRRVFLAKETEQYHVALCAPGVARNDPRRFAATLLDQILGGGASSRLFQEIRERRGMAYAVYSYLSHYRDTGAFGVYLGTREENLDECLEIVGRELQDLAARGPDDDELERAKDNVEGRLLLAMESTGARMARLGKGLVTGTELLEEDEIVERVRAVTRADVAALVRDVLAAEQLSAACIGPDEDVFGRAADGLLEAGDREAT